MCVAKRCDHLMHNLGVAKTCDHHFWTNKILLSCITLKLCTSRIEKAKKKEIRRSEIDNKLQKEKMYAKKKINAFLRQNCPLTKKDIRPRQHCRLLNSAPRDSMNKLCSEASLCRYLHSKTYKSDCNTISVEEEEHIYLENFETMLTNFDPVLNDLTHILLNDFQKIVLIEKVLYKKSYSPLDIEPSCSAPYFETKLKRQNEKICRKLKRKCKNNENEINLEPTEKEIEINDSDLKATIKSRLMANFDEQRENQVRNENKINQENSNALSNISSRKAKGLNIDHNLIYQLIHEFDKLYPGNLKNGLSSSKFSMLDDDLVSEINNSSTYS